MSKFYTAVRVVYTLLFVGVSAWNINSMAIGMSPPGQQRYLSIGIMNVEDGDVYLPIMEKAAAAGINSFLLNVNWDHVYSKRGALPNWDQLDKEVALAEKLGCKIMLRIWVARHDDAAWWPDATRPTTGDGLRKRLLGGFSFNDQKAVAEANAFIREVTEHFRAKQQSGLIVLVSVATTDTAEIGYNFEGYSPASNRDILQTYDFSPYARKAFQDWAERKYKNVANLNKAWNSDFSRFSDISPPYTSKDPWSGFYGVIGMDWYVFRHSALKELMDGFARTIKGVDPGYKVVHDMGSCYDGISNIRGTLGFKDLCASSDGLKVNDDNSYPHRFATDLLRSNLPGKIIGHELGNTDAGSVSEWRRYIDEAYEHGVDWVNMFGFDRPFSFIAVEGLIKETAAKWLRTPIPDIRPTQTVTYTLSEALRQGTGNVQSRWRTEYAKSSKPIRVLLVEDMLGEDSRNTAPTVNKPIPDQQGKVNQPFEYVVPAETFFDSDGFIATITATGLPAGVSLADRSLAGIPRVRGDYPVTLTATDNAGASVTTSFKLTVTDGTGPNKPPTVNRSIPDQQGTVNQPFQYEIPTETFSDADGSITMVTVTGLPEAIRLADRKLTGSPTTSGIYTVTVTATDNAGDKVSTSFRLSVAPAPADNIVSFFKAGNFLTRRFIRYIQDGDTLRGDDVKQTVNIFASPRSGAVGSYSFVLTGPFSVGSEDSKAPYGLFGDNGGAVLAAGAYTLTVKSYPSADLKGTLLGQQTVHFVVLDEGGNQNLPPVLAKPPVELFAKVGTPYAYRLSDSTFVDPDGTITSFTLTGLPDGLKGDGTLITGTPAKKGIYNVTVRVTDNGNGVSSASFKFTVSADNLPPVVKNAIPDQIADIDKPFSYTLAENVFEDPDGKIVAMSILGLPPGLTGSGRLMSGTPTKAGEYQLVATATDDSNASTQLAFKLTVVAGNRPPLVARAISDQLADSNAVYRFVIAAGTFIDTDGSIDRLEITGLPPGLAARGDTISGRPTRVGEYAVNVRAFDNRNASAQLTFKLTVVGNRPPLVARAISDQLADSNAVYRFVIAAGTFIDTDGSIDRLEITGLPPGLAARGDTISGRPTRVGEYAVNVRAFDNRNASVQLTFKLTVRGVNIPPTVEPITDVLAIMGQIFSFDVKSHFKDSDGTIASVSYASALPPGITANGSQLAGNPTAVGEYPIKVVARDNKGASVAVEFILKVEKPELRVVMYQIGQQTRKAIREVANADIIALSSLPAALNLFVESNASITSVTFEMTGPVARKGTDEAAPFGLFGDTETFTPAIGTYRLKVTAYRHNTLVTSRSIQFDIIRANNSPVRLGVPESETFSEAGLWVPYPNPFADRVNVRIDAGGYPQPKAVEVLSAEGKVLPLAGTDWTMDQSRLEVNLSGTVTLPGMYLLRITDGSGRQKVLRILKAPRD